MLLVGDKGLHQHIRHFLLGECFQGTEASLLAVFYQDKSDCHIKTSSLSI